MYRLEFMPKAEDALARLDISIVRRIRIKLDRLCEIVILGLTKH